MSKCTKIIDVHYGRTDEFDVVYEFPDTHVVWNIGRHNFPHPGYIPLAKVTADCHIVPGTLKALYLGDENLCLAILREAGHHGVDKDKFLKIKEDAL
jgi:hypothetical protein